MAYFISRPLAAALVFCTLSLPLPPSLPRPISVSPFTLSDFCRLGRPQSLSVIYPMVLLPPGGLPPSVPLPSFSLPFSLPLFLHFQLPQEHDVATVLLTIFTGEYDGIRSTAIFPSLPNERERERALPPSLPPMRRGRRRRRPRWHS